MFDRIRNKDGIISFMPNVWSRSPAFLAGFMVPSDMEEILTACGGDFSLLDENTAQALSILASRMSQKRKEKNEEAKKARKARSTWFHNLIIDEIVDLMKDSGGFRTCDIQLAAAKRGKGFPVRTRQMYAAHLCREIKENGRITHLTSEGGCITVIYKDGHSGSQLIPSRGMWHVK